MRDGRHRAARNVDRGETVPRHGAARDHDPFAATGHARLGRYRANVPLVALPLGLDAIARAVASTLHGTQAPMVGDRMWIRASCSTIHGGCAGVGVVTQGRASRMTPA